MNEELCSQLSGPVGNMIWSRVHGQFSLQSCIKSLNARTSHINADLLSNIFEPSSAIRSFEMAALQHYSRAGRMALLCLRIPTSTNQKSLMRSHVLDNTVPSPPIDIRDVTVGDRDLSSALIDVVNQRHHTNPLLFLVIMAASSGVLLALAVALFYMGQTALFVVHKVKEKSS